MVLPAATHASGSTHTHTHQLTSRIDNKLQHGAHRFFVRPPGEVWSPPQHLREDATQGPQVDCARIARGVEEQLGRAVPPRHDEGCKCARQRPAAVCPTNTHDSTHTARTRAASDAHARRCCPASRSGRRRRNDGHRRATERAQTHTHGGAHHTHARTTCPAKHGTTSNAQQPRVPSHPEIAHHESTIMEIHEDVCWLQVPMNHVRGVYKLQGAEHLRRR